MGYSESLATRMRAALAAKRGIAEKNMFGGIGFLLCGNMLAGVWKTSLIARVGPDIYDEALMEPYVREFDITGKPMRGWVMVEADGLETDNQLEAWIERAWQFVVALPGK
jgi:hypothetical protein